MFLFSDVFGVDVSVDKLPWADELGVALSAAQLAVSLIRTSSSRRIVNVKGVNDFASEVDLRVEEAVKGFLVSSSRYPVQGEEFSSGEVAGSRWVVDPIDGTSNFVADIPLVAFNVALLVDGVPVVAVTSSVQYEEVFWATRGGGAFLNGRQIRVSDDSVGKSAVILGGMIPRGVSVWSASFRVRLVAALTGRVGHTRMLGTAATSLAWVAAGRVSACVEYSNLPWDTCAGALLVHEAGGVVLDARGEPWGLGSDSVVAVNSLDTAEVVGECVRVASGGVFEVSA